MLTKVCTKCGIEKPIGEFRFKKGYKDNIDSYCILCRRNYDNNYFIANKDKFHIKRKQWRTKHAEKIRQNRIKNSQKAKIYKLKKLYGMSWEEFQLLYKQQNGICGICKEILLIKGKHNEVCCVDHDHITYKIRGLLCHKCNKTLGLLKDNPDLCYAAGDYLKKHQEKKK